MSIINDQEEENHIPKTLKGDGFPENSNDYYFDVVSAFDYFYFNDNENFYFNDNENDEINFTFKNKKKEIIFFQRKFISDNYFKYTLKVGENFQFIFKCEKINQAEEDENCNIIFSTQYKTITLDCKSITFKDNNDSIKFSIEDDGNTYTINNEIIAIQNKNYTFNIDDITGKIIYYLSFERFNKQVANNSFFSIIDHMFKHGNTDIKSKICIEKNNQMTTITIIKYEMFCKNMQCMYQKCNESKFHIQCKNIKNVIISDKNNLIFFTGNDKFEINFIYYNGGCIVLNNYVACFQARGSNISQIPIDQINIYDDDNKFEIFKIGTISSYIKHIKKTKDTLQKYKTHSIIRTKKENYYYINTSVHNVNIKCNKSNCETTQEGQRIIIKNNQTQITCSIFWNKIIFSFDLKTFDLDISYDDLDINLDIDITNILNNIDIFNNFVKQDTICQEYNINKKNIKNYNTILQNKNVDDNIIHLINNKKNRMQLLIDTNIYPNNYESNTNDFNNDFSYIFLYFFILLLCTILFVLLCE